MNRPRIAVIGAGMAGLTFARTIKPHADVTVIEKSRGLGGRMATRQTENGSFDHGAQYFTVRDPRFASALAADIDDGSVQPWPDRVIGIATDGRRHERPQSGPTYIAVPGMTALAKSWAKGLDIQLNRTVKGIAGTAGAWMIETDQGPLGPFDWVVSTAPAPQTAALMPLGPVEMAACQSVSMQGCFTLMLTVKTGQDLPDEPLRFDHPVLGWLAVNDTKPGRAKSGHVVLHSNNAWADANLERPPDAVRDDLHAALVTVVDIPGLSQPENVTIHRWRYANVSKPLDRPFILDRERGLAACGDWCIGNRVEAAFVSGLELAHALADLP
ncbi:FAD-dependent oxidoreductase [Rhizobium sp. RU36D]|uniref:NAD(P)/FAD-dependent oxidoreductase n=1 Tax=Rhizobium sp. RU36D TaxID=1907415 RepID=UPI0009D89512|nr:FAD-dependent oxidoreductase [Rhizobium sp. RU36D]SMC73238.1 hypothetical protein SAMN05880593_105215 [Rhizobium sp. RU36D]